MASDPSILARVLERIEQLPPMPQTVLDVMQMSRNDDYSAADLAEVVCRDATLAARVLKLCNSGFFAVPQGVTGVHRAVLLLGFEMTQNLVLSSFVHSSIQGDLGGYAQTATSLWEHSFGVATAAMALAEVAGPELAEPGYTAGLLHDIGKVALASFAAEKMAEVAERVRSSREPFGQAEHAVLGTTHAEVGAVVAERWRLSPDLAEVIRHHHAPRLAGGSPRLAALVSLADGLCSLLGVGVGLDATDAGLDPWSLETLGLGGERLERALEAATGRVMSLRGSDLLGAG
ncbi:MAG: HDOD domain-containing protein [Deferrisomatales bacterium]